MTHFISPPPELAAKWVAEIYDHPPVPLHSITLQLVERAAQWGADQELEACCEWVKSKQTYWAHDELHAARRPKPPSLKEQALEALENLNGECLLEGFECPERVATIRRALEQLDD